MDHGLHRLKTCKAITVSRGMRFKVLKSIRFAIPPSGDVTVRAWETGPNKQMRINRNLISPDRCADKQRPISPILKNSDSEVSDPNGR